MISLPWSTSRPVLILAVGVAALLAYPVFLSTPADIPLPMNGAEYRQAQVPDAAHATAKHGTEADAIRRCLENNGPVQQWQKLMPDGSLSPDRFFLVCQLEEDRYGVQLVERTAEGAWKEITSYIPKGTGTGAKVMAYLARHAKMLDTLIPR